MKSFFNDRIVRNESVYDIIKRKNTDPTEEDILSFTEREFVHAHAWVKERVDNVRIDNHKYPFCGSQFLDEDYGLIKWLELREHNKDKGLDMSDLKHLDGTPKSMIGGKFPDKTLPKKKYEAEVKEAFADLTKRTYKQTNSSLYKEDRCDSEEECYECDVAKGRGI